MLVLMNIMDAIDICEYRSRYSNHVYTVKQKLVLLVLRQFMAISYREFCDRLPSLTRVCRSLGLDVIPHHSTLAKFSATVDADMLHRMVSGFSAACDGKVVTVAVDSTGFSEMCTSQYFMKRKKDFGMDPEPDERRGFSKATYAGDVGSKIILACDITDRHDHDITRMPDVIAHLKDADVEVDFVLADKGYDAEWVHRMVNEELGAEALIPARERKPSRGSRPGVFSTKGVNRSRMKRIMVKCTIAQLKFRMRAIIECMNSMVKRKMGGCVFSRLDATKRTELMCRAIAHNMRRVIDLGRQNRFI